MTGVLQTGVNRYGPPPPAPRIADLQHELTPYHYGRQEAGLTICFLDGSRAEFAGIKSEDWDHAMGALTVVRGKVEHVFPLAQVAYIRWQEP